MGFILLRRSFRLQQTCLHSFRRETHSRRLSFSRAWLSKCLASVSYDNNLTFYKTGLSSTYFENFNSLTHNRLYSTNFRVKSTLKMSKMDSPEYHSLFTPELKLLISLFEKYNHELRIAGGAVRDLLLGKLPHDVDFATTATPAEMKDIFEKENIRMINNKGESHGTVTCRINDKENFEVTTLRIDVATDGRHAEVEFTKDWELDALRRDLTINSMFLGFDGTVYDYFNGQEDLRNKRVRFVGSASDRIREDYLRILRYFRFYGRIAEDANSHEDDTLRAIKDNASGLAGIAGERIWVEVKKIMTSNHAASLFRVMVELGIAPYIGFPETVNVAELEKVYTRCSHLSPHPMTLLAAALQDELQVNQLNDRVKMSKDELKTGIFIVQHRDDNPTTDSLLPYCQDLLCDTSGKEPRTKEKIMELLKYWGYQDILKAFQTWELPKFPVTGHSLLKKGVKKGPALAKTLNVLRQIWKDSGYTATEEKLLDMYDELQSKK